MSVADPKGQPFSIRLSATTEMLVEAEAKRTKRSRSAIVESLTEEAARGRRFPGIGFRGDDASRRAWVIGTGLDVWEVVEMLEDHGDAAKLIRETQLEDRHIRIAEIYRKAYPVEIDEAIAENRRPVEEWQSLFPFIERSSA